MRMKNNFIAMFTTTTLLAVAFICTSGKASAQTKEEPIELKAQAGMTTRGTKTDKNIKVDEKPNKAGESANPPAGKAGTRSSAAAGCRVELDNSTGWFIKVYVDGVFRGTMGKWDDSYLTVLPGETTVYARADFDDGSYKYWGPKLYSCGPGKIIYFKMIR